MDIKKIYQVSSPILLTGETGTGKSRLAEIIHVKSRKKHKKFITVHLASLSESLIESELYGHAKGAFTGAFNEKKGYCEMVEDGTLFLDEIAELSLGSQKKLLFLLEEKKFCPVGSVTQKYFRGRIIAATNKNLCAMVQEGTFREDLYFRLRVFCHEIPPLRKNKNQLVDLAEHYLKKFKSEHEHKQDLCFSSECLQLLKNYSWPGNIRELRNAMEYAVNSSDRLITVKDLPKWILESESKKGSESSDFSFFGAQETPINYYCALETFEKKYFLFALNYYGGKVNLTAREMKISKSTLIAKIRKYGINIWRIKAKEVDSLFQETKKE